MKGLLHTRNRIKATKARIMIQQFWQGQWRQVWMMSFVFALLLMFLHVFVLAATLTGHATDSVKEKLGVYFYVKDATQMGSGVTQEQLSSRIVKFKDELEKWGVAVAYYSKDDALQNLQRRLPNMVKNFDQYGIENPLPVTLYVTFQDQEQYDFVMEAKKWYEDMLLSGPSGGNTDQQFTRNARVINVLHVLQFFFVFIIIACVVVILVFLGMIIKTKFTAMHHTINVQKLLGSPYARLKQPFFFNSFVLLILGYVMTLILSSILIYNLSSIFPYLFGMPLSDLFGGKIGLRFIWLFVEFIALLGIARWYANWQLTVLLRKE